MPFCVSYASSHVCFGPLVERSRGGAGGRAGAFSIRSSAALGFFGLGAASAPSSRSRFFSFLAGAADAPLLSLSFFLIFVALALLSPFGLGGFAPLSALAGFGFFGKTGAASFAFAAFSLSRSCLITQIGLSSSLSDASAMAVEDLSLGDKWGQSSWVTGGVKRPGY